MNCAEIPASCRLKLRSAALVISPVVRRAARDAASGVFEGTLAKRESVTPSKAETTAMTRSPLR
jgi:hypothetical protein